MSENRIEINNPLSIQKKEKAWKGKTFNERCKDAKKMVDSLKKKPISERIWRMKFDI